MPSALRTETLNVKHEDSAGLVFSFDAPKGRVLGVMVTSLAGNARGNLTVLGLAHEMRPADVVRLLPRLRARLGAES